MTPYSTDKNRLTFSLSFFAIAAFCSLTLYVAFIHFPYLKGTDTYYYALQVDHWARTGHVKIPDSSWIFPVLGLLQRIGYSTENVICIFTVVSIASMAFLFYLSLPKATPLRRTLSCIWILLSPTLLFTAIEFPKMFITLLTLSLWDFSPKKNKLFVSLIALILAFCAHRSSLLVIGAFGLGWWLDQKLKRHLWVMGSFFVLCGATFLFGDRSLFVDVNRFLQATLATPGLLSLISRNSLPFALKAELTIFAILFLYFFLQKIFQKNSRVPFRYLLIGMLAFVPLGSSDIFSLGERLTLFLPLSVILIYAHATEMTDQESLAMPGVLLFSLFIVSFMPSMRLELSHPRSLDPDYVEMELITKTLSQQSLPLLIAHKNMAYFYKYRLGREAFPYEPEEHWEKTKVWRLVYHVRLAELWSYLPVECRNHYFNYWNDYTLLREDCWFNARAKISREKDSDLYDRAWNTFLNPSKRRPGFLYRKHENESSDDSGEFPALKR